MAKILIVDDEESIRYTLKVFLSRDGHEVFTASNYHDALKIIECISPDLVFADIIMDDGTGIDLLKTIKEQKLSFPIILMTGEPNVETATKALRLDAFDYLPKPIDKKTVLTSTSKALKYYRLKIEEETIRQNMESAFHSVQEGIVTTDANMRVMALNTMTDKICGPLTNSWVGEKFGYRHNNCSQACKKAIKETLASRRTVAEYSVACHHKLRPRQRVVVKSSPLMDPMHQFSGAVLMIREMAPMPLYCSAIPPEHQPSQIIGNSKSMQKIYAMINYLANVETAVLITGNTGTGKELVAKAIHYAGQRSEKPLVTVNCSALNENLLESELFGHVTGAFTGALKDKIGRFEEAGDGTLFLDEIGDVSPKIQIKLLRVLQEKEIERVGDSRTIKLNMRVVAATNQDLKKKVAKGEFREDLYYRLKVVQLHLPTLRRRQEDIPLLVEHFCSKFRKIIKKNISGVSDEVLTALMAYEWPGNVRELEHTIEHAFVLCPDSIITMKYLPKELAEAVSRSRNDVEPFDKDDKKEQLKHALEKSGWNKARAARLLGVSRQTLYRKIRTHNLVNSES